MTTPSSALLEQRVQALAALYRQVQRERMQGVPLLNPALHVQALGFEWPAAQAGQDAATLIAEGVLITPWFMSLVRLPAQAQPHRDRVGCSQTHAFGCESFDFIGAHDPALGYHETCALFSPMQEFDSQERACETAREALALLRPPARAAVPARRAFFLAQGRACQP
jgi:[NiFe] hydrogenase assembly HybE family chaperone